VAGQFEASPAFADDASIIFAPGRIQPQFGTTGETRAFAPYKVNKKENTMNWDRVEGDWKQIKGKAQQKWGKLTNDDLDVIEGKRTELAGRLQERYGYAKDEAEREIDSWVKTIN
jgi:uncharacterized protein YjbJ (UPF0337 family)